jgi:hypothetical protein
MAASRFVVAEQTQPAFEDDIQEYSDKSGIGCVSKHPVSSAAEFYFVCRSRRSAEAAWSAALYRGKLSCGGANFDLFFNVSPGLPKEGDIYVAQVELKCSKGS